jgi:hypothetical protein
MLAENKLDHTPDVTVKMGLYAVSTRPPVEVYPMTWFLWRQRCESQRVILTFKLLTATLPSSI